MIYKKHDHQMNFFLSAISEKWTCQGKEESYLYNT